IASDGSEALKATICSNSTCHIAATSADSNPNQRDVRWAGLGENGGCGGFYVFHLGERGFEMARVSAAFPQRAIIEREGQKAALCQSGRVGARRLLLHAGQRPGEHGTRARPTASGREEIPNKRRAVHVELVAM